MRLPIPLAFLIIAIFLIPVVWRSYQPTPAYTLGRAMPQYPELRRPQPFRSYQPEWQEQAPASCEVIGVTCSSEDLAAWREPGDSMCTARLTGDSYPLPDPRCTPGGINTTVTADILRDPRWRTRCTRDCQVSEADKHAAYAWYGIDRPRHNFAEDQVCELDHLVPLELGGSDDMGNIWPECGPNDVALDRRFFKLKDRVENYLADAVRRGAIPLDTAQHGIASDWTLFLPAANRYCNTGGRCP